MNAKPKDSFCTERGRLLIHCLVEGDEVALVLARRLRRRAVLAAVLLESISLGTLLLFPLLATGQRFVLRQVVPVPPLPYGGAPRLDQAAKSGSVFHHRKTSPGRVIFQPPRIPSSVASGDRDPAQGGGAREASPGNEPPRIEGSIPGGEAPLPMIIRAGPSAPPVVEKPVKRSEGVQQALLLHRVEPVYPPLAREVHLEGVVRLRAIIGQDGSVRTLAVLSGHPILAQAALNAVSQWRYRPTLLNGRPVEVETYVTVIFELRH